MKEGGFPVVTRKGRAGKATLRSRSLEKKPGGGVLFRKPLCNGQAKSKPECQVKEAMHWQIFPVNRAILYRVGVPYISHGVGRQNCIASSFAAGPICVGEHYSGAFLFPIALYILYVPIQAFFFPPASSISYTTFFCPPPLGNEGGRMHNSGREWTGEGNCTVRRRKGSFFSAPLGNYGGQAARLI